VFGARQRPTPHPSKLYPSKEEETEMNIQVPRPVAAYLEAEAAKDAARLTRCFHPDAVVRDEGREHRGVAAIEAWYRDANTRFRFVVSPRAASVDGPTVVVRTHVTGDFPGGAAELRCTFEVDEDRIQALEISQ
jgi:hypothetical protein